jgi:cell wall-associated NlpC family hydrolase
MRSGPSFHVALAACAAIGLIAGGIGVPQAQASPVDQQRQRVEAIADELEALENRIGELDEQHGAALDRIDQLTAEIEVAQTKVDSQQTQLSQLQTQLSQIALDKFMTGGASGPTPLLGSATALTQDLQRGELSRVALDQGAGSSDEMESLVSDLTEETQALEAKKTEQASLIASLESQQEQGQALADQYTTKYASAQAELGNLVAEEEERRAAAAVAQAQAREAQKQAKAAQPSRGGGVAPATPAAPASTNSPVVTNPPAADNGGGGGGGGNDDGGGGNNTPDPVVLDTPDPPPEAPSVPPPSSLSGIAVSAASSQLGVPYRFAAESPGVAFDCSGLTKYSWGKAGVYLPHQSAQQYASTPHVPKEDVQPGDLIFYKSPIGHVGIYIGNGQMIHAPSPGKFVMVATVYWNKVVGVSRPG